MSIKLPDSVQSARQEAQRIASNRHFFLVAPIERVMKDAPFVDRDSLLAGLEAFHKERMAKTPSYSEYPEARLWVEHALALDHELQKAANLTDLELATYRSLGPYLTFRGYVNARSACAEKCRVVYLPQTDRGQLHIKNVDDPITYWKPDPRPHAKLSPPEGLFWDGAGSGLHIDDEPDEIFPLPVTGMCRACCGDVPGAVEFLRRYRKFWGGGNAVLHDRQGRSVAIEKGSYNFIDVYAPDRSGGSHCSGMVFRSPRSAQGSYAWKKRRHYLRLFKQPLDGPDMTFWKACDRAERMLARLMDRPSLRAEEVIKLFTTPWPDGLNKCGAKFHPDQGYAEYTLVTRAIFLDERRSLIWQRSADGVYPDAPEVYDW